MDTRAVGPVPAPRADADIVRVVIIDDIRLYREGLAQALCADERIRVVGTAGERDEALASLLELRPDIVLLRVGSVESLRLVRALTGTQPETRVIALGVDETDDAVLACIESGSAGYLLRQGSLADLRAAVESVARGETLCSPRVAATLMRRVAALAAGHQPAVAEPQLTPRERDIVRLIDEGLSNKEVALRLSIEVHTVKNHVHNILEKLQVRHRWEVPARVRSMRADPSSPRTGPSG